MKKKWLNFLKDPITKDFFELKIDSLIGEEIISGKLISKEHSYSIIKGVPRFIDKTFSNDLDKNKTTISFGNKWSSDLLEGYEKQRKESLKERFLSILGVENKEELKKVFKDNMNCLDIGCGIAWPEYLFNINKKVNRFAVDLSFSVEKAYKKTKNISNIFIGQADLFNLPFKDNFFDIIFADGVLHHTGNTKKAFYTLSKYLKPNGLIGIYIYSQKPFLRELADYKIREITTEMTFKEVQEFSEQMAKFGKSLQKFKDDLKIESDIPLLGIKKGNYNLQKFIYDYFLKCFYNKEWGDNSSIINNLDWYYPKYASHHSKKEIKSWFEENNFSGIKFIQPKGWEFSGYFVSARKK
ncbi:MAG: class I SAM-dependent methyltransferase [Candidatus Nealsonbacteria bacterium]